LPPFTKLFHSSKEGIMKLIQKLMGRRQFLAAAGAGSASALTLGKLGGMWDPAFRTQVAMAAETAGAAGTKGADNRYPNLLAPIKIGSYLLKNRIFYPVSQPHMLNGPENFPNEIMRSYYANVAKTAAVVTVRLETGTTPRTQRMNDSAHMIIFDLDDCGVQNYISQMIEAVHSMGALAVTDMDVGDVSAGGGQSMTMAQARAKAQQQAQGGGASGQAQGQGGTGAQGGMPGGGEGGGQGGMPMGMPGGMGGQSAATEPVVIDDIITAAKKAVDQGLDLVHIGAVRNLTDTVAIDNAIKKIEAVKKYTNLITIMNCPGSGPGGTSGNPQETAVTLANKFEGLVDIWRAGGSPSTGIDQEFGDPSCLKITEAIKKSGVKTITMAGGGFIFPDKVEEYIATGKCDMVALARPILADFDYGKKLYEGRGEDIAPCVLCQKCHGQSFKKDWFSVCTANPKLGNDVATRVIDAPKMSKKVAIIGGGPAGMRAAITAVERGHKVTLYEKEAQLGGLLRRYSDASSYKWPYKAYKDYLVRHVNKLGIDIKLNAEATPEMIKKAGYDVVMVAIGSEALMPKIPGATEKNVYNVIDIFGKDKELGKSVAFIGAGEFGTESALYLGKAGLNVTCMTSEKELVVNDRPHGPGATIQAYRAMKNFTGLTQATVKSISNGKVTYTDSTGAEKTVQADSVVIFGGLKGKQDEALKFNGTAKKGVYPIGDCTGRCGNIQKANRSAFYLASQI
jgi:2,4-dienoyl-CoA reductase-like NADH-dependent reductase (Old Yellow Enzyme family)/thioredoxin reductase